MFNLSHCVYKLALGSLILSFSMSNVSAQTLSEQIINLDVGQWANEQVIYINDRHQQALDLNGTQCLTDADANLSIQDYVDKLMAGVGVDVNCELSNVKNQANRIDFDLMCSNQIGLTTQLSMYYEYSRELVSYEANGTISGVGQARDIRVVGQTKRLGDCEN